MSHCLLTQNPFLPVPPPPAQGTGPPKDVPLPTPVHFPECRPRAANPGSAESNGPADAPSAHLATILQNLIRPAEQVELALLEALGVHVTADAELTNLIPDPLCLPDFDKWDSLSREDAHVTDAQSRAALCNGKLAPGATKYVDLRQGLLTENDRAFRAVRRVAPRPGEQYVRLGYCHEFFRHLETLTGFWEDTSATKPPRQPDGSPEANTDENSHRAPGNDGSSFYRTSAGSTMPAQYRTQLLGSFLRLITYDFSCSISSRQEPRLYIRSPPLPSSPTNASSAQRHSYFSSGCNFIFRMPVDRDSAKRGIVDGPIAAVSPRHTTVFPPVGRERESVIDLSREIIAALITSQHRAREGRQEERIGRDAWWATKRRWGGGPGGPIGKETEALESKDASAVLVGDKDERPGLRGSVVEGDESPTVRGSSPPNIAGPSPMGLRGPSRASFGRIGSAGSGTGESSPSQPPNPKRPRKGMAIYDAYRMVRPPSMHWDPKTRYAAIGRQRGVDYDDVFVISCLFHHISILRVRVPDRLLEVLDGAVPDPGVKGRGKLGIWRTRWFDLFVAQDRVEAMKAVWGIMAYSMRSAQSADDGMQVEEDNKSVMADGEVKKASPR